jgi:hypothetical protein
MAVVLNDRSCIDDCSATNLSFGVDGGTRENDAAVANASGWAHDCTWMDECRSAVRSQLCEQRESVRVVSYRQRNVIRNAGERTVRVNVL